MRHTWGLALALCVACGDDEGGGGAADSKQVDALSVAEFREFCAWTIQHENDALSLEQFCTIDAVESSLDSDECETAYDECIEEEEPLWDSELQDALEECDELEESDLPSACSVTLGALRDCYEALDAELSQAGRSFSCEEPGETLPDASPAACTRIEDDCEELVSGAKARQHGVPATAIVGPRRLR